MNNFLEIFFSTDKSESIKWPYWFVWLIYEIINLWNDFQPSTKHKLSDIVDKRGLFYLKCLQLKWLLLCIEARRRTTKVQPGGFLNNFSWKFEWCYYFWKKLLFGNAKFRSMGHDETRSTRTLRPSNQSSRSAISTTKNSYPFVLMVAVISGDPPSAPWINNNKTHFT